jgi:integrase
LKALVDEDLEGRRAVLLWLLTAARVSEVGEARRSELVNGIWTIPAHRAKNSCAHSIALGPWGQSLMANSSDWIFPAIKNKEKPRNRAFWYKVRDRVIKRMEEISGQSIERFTPHDFRRTVRSNTTRLKINFETAEAILNHRKSGMARIYDGYEMEDEKAAWFLKWEQEIIALAVRAGVADALGIPPTLSSKFRVLAGAES